MSFLRCEPFTEGLTEEKEVFTKPSVLEGKIAEGDYSHIVVWESLYDASKHLFSNYTVAHRVFHSHFGESPLGYETYIHFLILKKHIAL